MRKCRISDLDVFRCREGVGSSAEAATARVRTFEVAVWAWSDSRKYAIFTRVPFYEASRKRSCPKAARFGNPVVGASADLLDVPVRVSVLHIRSSAEHAGQVRGVARRVLREPAVAETSEGPSKE